MALAGLAAALAVPGFALAGFGDVTLIHTGDIHGHLVPRPNVRSDTTGKLEGGVARMYTVIQQIRKEAREAHVDKALLINTGDTLQGSGEALFTRGKAMFDVLNQFGFDAFAPGNWDFLYGTDRFEETFKGVGTPDGKPLAPWNALASNLYYGNPSEFDDAAVCGISATDPSTGTVRPLKRVLPPYLVKQVGKVKVGILGFTTARAIAAVGTTVTKGYQYADGKTELPCFIDVLRNQEKVDLLVMISELEMARDIQLAETYPGVDVILNSDMHERTIEPIVASTGTIIVEEGQDGTTVGELNLKIGKGGGVTQWKWTPHIITDNIREDKAIAAKVAEVRKPFLGPDCSACGSTITVGGNTTELMRPVDEVIAYTDVDLHRSNFVDKDMPAVVEGSSHDLIADAMATLGQAQSASIRGFRYGTHVPAGWGITMEDIYHYVPIAAKLGRTNKACGADLKFAIEQSTYGTFSPDPAQWTGGWMFGYSGLTMDVDACDGFMGATPVPVSGPTLADPAKPWSTNRGSNVLVGGMPIDDHELYDSRTSSPTFQQCLPSDGGASRDGYTVTGYWYADDPTTINNCNPCRGRTIQVVKTDGSIVQVAGPGAPSTLPDSLDVMDVTEAVVQYLREDLGGMVTEENLQTHRLTVNRLPTINPFPFDVIQPLLGASVATCPSLP